MNEQHDGGPGLQHIWLGVPAVASLATLAMVAGEHPNAICTAVHNSPTRSRAPIPASWRCLRAGRISAHKHSLLPVLGAVYAGDPRNSFERRQQAHPTSAVKCREHTGDEFVRRPCAVRVARVGRRRGSCIHDVGRSSATTTRIVSLTSLEAFLGQLHEPKAVGRVVSSLVLSHSAKARAPQPLTSR